jgi:hypothetical protein
VKATDLTAEARALRHQIEADRERNAESWSRADAALEALVRVEQDEVGRSERRGLSLTTVALALQFPLVGISAVAISTGIMAEPIDSALKTGLGIGTGVILLVVCALLTQVARIFVGLRQHQQEYLEIELHRSHYHDDEEIGGESGRAMLDRHDDVAHRRTA